MIHKKAQKKLPIGNICGRLFKQNIIIMPYIQGFAAGGTEWLIHVVNAAWYDRSTPQFTLFFHMSGSREHTRVITDLQ